MCLEHKQYWQCCLTIDSKYIDPCPLSGAGASCNISERVHPIGGYCAECCRARNKLEDDAVTSPLYTKNDGYDRPWEDKRPLRPRAFKSQPVEFPTGSRSRDEPDRGRKPRRSPSPVRHDEEVRRLSVSSNEDCIVHERGYQPSHLSSDNRYTSREHHDHQPSQLRHDRPTFKPHSTRRYTSHSPSVSPRRGSRYFHKHADPSRSTRDSPQSFSYSSYKPNKDKDKYKYETPWIRHTDKQRHSRDYDRPSPSSSRSPLRSHRHGFGSGSGSGHGRVKYRVASPATIRRLQRKGILPDWDRMHRLPLPSRSKR